MGSFAAAMLQRLSLPSTSAALLFYAGLCRDACASGIGARPADVLPCSCPDPRPGRDTCYEPVCASGYFKCCAGCSDSTCANQDQMEISWRGINECIKCYPGDYCDGCDSFFTCPVSNRPGREGPRVSRPGASRLADCEACPTGTEASVDRGECVPKYTDACDLASLQRCTRLCESEDPARGKQLTECEKMKCLMFCAGRDPDSGEKCTKRLKAACKFKTVRDTTPQSVGLDPGLVEDVQFIDHCDVDCDSASRLSTSLMLAVGLLVHLLSQERM